MKVTELQKPEASDAGYLTYNSGPHLCVDLGEGCQTISVKLRNGRRVVFGFVQGEEDFACVDIADDTLGNTDQQKVCVMGRGPTFYAAREDEVTVTSISLRKV